MNNMAVHFAYLYVCVAVLLVRVVSAQQLGSPDNSQVYEGPYIQVYPPVDLSQDQQNCSTASGGTCPLFIALIQSFGGQFDGRGTIPGVQIALDQINADPSILPGYTLHYTLTDSQCDRTIGLDALAAQILHFPTKVGVIGSGCSLATEPTAEISHYYNITQISCISSSSELRNRERFRYYFQVIASDLGLAFGYFGLIEKFEWRKVGIITQDENLFTVTVGNVMDFLEEADITVTETRFVTEEGIQSLGDIPFDIGSGTRIFILAMFESHARRVLCQAYRNDIHYPEYLFLTYAWYTPDWWVGSEEEQEELKRDFNNCTAEQRAEVAEYTLAVRHAEFISDNSTIADSGINGTQFLELSKIYRNASLLNLNFTLLDPDYSQHCYDATWTLARGLNAVLEGLDNDTSLGDRLAEYNAGLSLAPGEDFGLQHFTYNNSGVLDIVFDTIEKTNFTGITGPITFNKSDGVRRVNMITVFSHQFINGSLQRIEVGNIDFSDTTDLKFSFIDGFSEDNLWGAAGRPYDGQPNEVVVTVSVALTVIFSLLATAGIVFAVVCLVFNIVFRDRKLIRLSSPKLNLLIGFGAIVLYIDVYCFVIPTTNPTAVAVFCNITPWLTGLGYSLCYGTILAKMFRVYYIFNNPTPKKKTALQDWMLALGVLLLVVIDLIILITYTAVEGARGNLAAQRVPNRENTEDITGARAIVTQYFIFICDSRARSIMLGILYGYKAVLQVIALIFTFSIRKVKVKGLNDAIYIAAAIYVTSIVTAVIIVCTYTLKDFINGYSAVFGGGFFVGTTGILMLVFIPKMVNLYKDPTGEFVFSKTEIPSSHHPASAAPPPSGAALGSQRTGGDSSNNSHALSELRSKDEEIAMLKAKIKELEESQVHEDSLVKPNGNQYHSSLAAPGLQSADSLDQKQSETTF